MKRSIGYWAVTSLLGLGMLAGGLAQLFRAKPNMEGIQHLGYPIYLLTIVGFWKVIGVVALLVPGYPLVKEWAYAGFFFVLTGAVVSHAACGDGISQIAAPLIFTVLTVLSWYLRPEDRKTNP